MNSAETPVVKPGRGRSPRNIQTFEPRSAILEMIHAEVEDRKRRGLCYSKTLIFEDSIAAFLGRKHPKQLKQFRLERKMADARLDNFVETGGVDSAREIAAVPLLKEGSGANPGQKVLAVQPLKLSTPVPDIPGGDPTVPA